MVTRILGWVEINRKLGFYKCCPLKSSFNQIIGREKKRWMQQHH